MTNPTNWPNPNRPGYPMFPERDGLHVILWGRGGNPALLRWVAKKNAYTWAQKIMWDGPYTYANEVCETWIYCGPCLTPSKIAEMLAAERERIKSMVTRACNLGNIITVLQRDMIIAGIDSETAIRNLGAAP